MILCILKGLYEHHLLYSLYTVNQLELLTSNFMIMGHDVAS